MLNPFKQLDEILRGDATQTARLKDGRIDIPIGGLLGVVVLLGAICGACIGAYGLFRIGGEAAMQILASAVKLPLLFFLTLLVTLPSLYVFNALVGSRLGLRSVLRLLVAMLGVTMAVLASLGPIIVFFSVSTTSYPFMKLLNVACATVAGVLGLAFLLRTLQRLVWMREVAAMAGGENPEPSQRRVQVHPEQPGGESNLDERENAGEPAAEGSSMQAASMPAAPATQAATPDQGTAPTGDIRAQIDAFQASHPDPHPADPAPRPGQPRHWPDGSGPLDRGAWTGSRRAKVVFRIWVVVFALVGAQMSWVLRPFIGDPNLPFAWFRERESNFFMDVAGAVGDLVLGDPDSPGLDGRVRTDLPVSVKQ